MAKENGLNDDMRMTTYHITPLSKGRPKGTKTFDEASTRALGLALKVTRLERGISQETLAAGAGLDRTYISRIERGINAPVITVIFRIAEYMDINPGEIVDMAYKILKKESTVLETDAKKRK